MVPESAPNRRRCHQLPPAGIDTPDSHAKTPPRMNLLLRVAICLTVIASGVHAADEKSTGPAAEKGIVRKLDGKPLTKPASVSMYEWLTDTTMAVIELEAIA